MGCCRNNRDVMVSLSNHARWPLRHALTFCTNANALTYCISKKHGVEAFARVLRQAQHDTLLYFANR